MAYYPSQPSGAAKMNPYPPPGYTPQAYPGAHPAPYPPAYAPGAPAASYPGASYPAHAPTTASPYADPEKGGFPPTEDFAAASSSALERVEKSVRMGFVRKVRRLPSVRAHARERRPVGADACARKSNTNSFSAPVPRALPRPPRARPRPRLAQACAPFGSSVYVGSSQVYGILMAQLALTFGIVCIFNFSSTAMQWVLDNPRVVPVAWVLSIAFLITIACCPGVSRKYPTNYLCLFAFTALEGFLLGVITARYGAWTRRRCRRRLQREERQGARVCDGKGKKKVAPPHPSSLSTSPRVRAPLVPQKRTWF